MARLGVGCGGLRSASIDPAPYQVVHGGHLSADEVLLEVGVDEAGSYQSRRVAVAGPGPHLGTTRVKKVIGAPASRTARVTAATFGE